MDIGMNDTKPDISQLSISTTSSGPFTGIGGGGSVSSRYLSGGGSVSSTQQGFAYGLHQSHSAGSLTGGNNSGGYYDGSGIFGHGGGGPLQSPLLHSQASMSPVHFGSPGMNIGSANVTSPLSSFSPPMPSPTSSMLGNGSSGGQNLLIANTKHICAICGDRASGKHYGVYSCEGCKGFFKRTVRKELQYACRDEKNCIVDKRQRNRCQYCRYQKCLTMGMKREAVQEERQRAKEKGEVEVESTTSANSEMPVELILEAELAADALMDFSADMGLGGGSGTTLGYGGNGDEAARLEVPDVVYQAMERQLTALVDWAKRVPHFVELPLDDQVTLLRVGWNELLIASFSHQSVMSRDSLLLATGLHIYRNTAHQVGIVPIFERILTELVSKMREMAMDKTELGCLRAIVLFNPDAKTLSAPQTVESLREKVYATLDEHCKQQYPDEPGRFAKLLLRLPALRSIGLKCTDHLFTSRLIGIDTPIDAFLLDLLESQSS